MREYQFETDSYRMFAAMCRVCQSPVSWYSSGPAQKFMLRQIKRMDQLLTDPEREDVEGGTKGARPKGLDVCLLMIYGQILFASTSYTYALNYFMRAHSVDPTNTMVNLSIALGYIHQALKRQSDNRQFLLAQGFSFLFQYYHDRLAAAGETNPEIRQEAHYNVARCYHLLGIHHLAVEYYRRVLEDARHLPAKPNATAPRMSGEDSMDLDGENGAATSSVRDDVVLEAATNLRTFCLVTGDFASARRIANEWLVL